MKRVGTVYECDISGKMEKYANIKGKIYNVAPHPINKTISEGVAALIKLECVPRIRIIEAKDVVVEAAKATLQMYDDAASDDVGYFSKGDLGYCDKIRKALAALDKAVRDE